MDIITLALAKQFATNVAAGFSSVSVNGQKITFTLNDGTQTSLTVPTPSDGVSITNAEVNSSNHLILTLSSGSTVDAGQIATVKGDKGEKGDSFKYTDFSEAQLNALKGSNGVSPTVVAAKTNGKTTLTITDVNGTSSVDILDGAVDSATLTSIQSRLTALENGTSGGGSGTSSEYNEEEGILTLTSGSVISDTDGNVVLG